MNTAHLPGSVLGPDRKPWTRTPEAVAELTEIVTRQAAERADRRTAALIADAVTAERDAADAREQELLDAEYDRFLPVLTRRTRPAYVEDLIPQRVRDRYDTERGAV